MSRGAGTEDGKAFVVVDGALGPGDGVVMFHALGSDRFDWDTAKFGELGKVTLVARTTGIP